MPTPTEGGGEHQPRQMEKFPSPPSRILEYCRQGADCYVVSAWTQKLGASFREYLWENFFLFNRVWLLFMDQEEFLFAQKKLKSCAHVSCCWDTHAFMNRMCDDGLGLTFVSRSDLTLESASSRVRLSYREKERFPPNCYIIYIFYSFIPIPPSSPTWKIQFFH